MNTEAQYFKTYERMQKKFLEESVEQHMHLLRKQILNHQPKFIPQGIEKRRTN